MKQLSWLIGFFCCFALKAIAGPVDSLVHFSDLDFNSERERTNFLGASLKNKTVDEIDLLLAPYDKPEGYSSKNAHQQINECVAYLEKETVGQANNKRVKFIYKYVHKRFFKVYKLHNSFSDIFEKGEYNCVSASALYAIVLNKLHIPCQIVEELQHVYLVAYPQQERIILETTAPANGYIQISDNYIEKYTKHLADSKIITKEEYEKTNTNDLFNKIAIRNALLHNVRAREMDDLYTFRNFIGIGATQ